MNNEEREKLKKINQSLLYLTAQFRTLSDSLSRINIEMSSLNTYLKIRQTEIKELIEHIEIIDNSDLL